MLSRTAEHALRALMYLARQQNGPVPAADIAEAIGAPANYLGKTLGTLVQRGLVEGRRGPHGGFRLRVDPARIAIADVVDAVGEPRARELCLLGGRPCNEEEPCEAHRTWVRVEQASRRPLEDTSLASLLGDASPL
jgi:Rrf2 family protein